MLSEQTNAQVTETLRQILQEDLTILLQLSPRSSTLNTALRDAQHLVNTATII